MSIELLPSSPPILGDLDGASANPTLTGTHASQGRRIAVWSRNAVLNSIRICGEMKVDRLIGTKVSAKWKIVTQQLALNGFYYTPEQVKLKWFHEKATYRRFLDNKKLTGRRRIEYRFSEEMAKKSFDIFFGQPAKKASR